MNKLLVLFMLTTVLILSTGITQSQDDLFHIERGAVGLNADGTRLIVGNDLYDMDDLTQPIDTIEPLITTRFASANLFSPTDPHLLFQFVEDTRFALVDIETGTQLWSVTYDGPPTEGIAGGLFALDAHFAPDGSHVIFSTYDEDSLWVMLDIETLTTTEFSRPYFGSAIAIAPDGRTITRSIQERDTTREDAHPGLVQFDLTTLTTTDVRVDYQRPANIFDLQYLPDGRLITSDSDDVMGLWNADLSFERTLLDDAEGGLWKWVIGIDYVAIAYGIREDDVGMMVVHLLDIESLEEAGQVRVPIEEPDTSPSYVGLVSHPDGRLGIWMHDDMQWLDVDSIVVD